MLKKLKEYKAEIAIVAFAVVSVTSVAVVYYKMGVKNATLQADALHAKDILNMNLIASRAGVLDTILEYQAAHNIKV